jgi:hypothetical protein
MTLSDCSIESSGSVEGAAAISILGGLNGSDETAFVLRNCRISKSRWAVRCTYY